MCKCKIKGCKAKVVAKRLCAKHYMRRRRTGDVNQTRKAGRKRDPMREMTDRLFREWSPRTRATFSAANKLLNASVDRDEAHRIMARATRPNGSMNVTRLYEMAVAHYVSAHPDEFDEADED